MGRELGNLDKEWLIKEISFLHEQNQIGSNSDYTQKDSL